MKTNLIKKGEILEIFTDGASRGNPGPGAWAFIFIIKQEMVYKNNGFLGKATNNIAEYNAIIYSLQEAKSWTKKVIKIYSDSQLVIRQINREYKINKPHLLKLYEKVSQVVKSFEKVDFYHVSRDNKYIKICDSLCNKSLDENI